MSRQRKLRKALNRAIGDAQSKDTVARRLEEVLLDPQLVPTTEVHRRLTALVEAQQQADEAWMAASQTLDQLRPLVEASSIAFQQALLDAALEQHHRVLNVVEQVVAGLQFLADRNPPGSGNRAVQAVVSGWDDGTATNSRDCLRAMAGQQ